MKILYLYPDLMNLYGESGNLCALERRLADQGEDVSVDRKATGEALEIAAYDWIYMGAGTERSQKAALEHLRPCAGALREAMDAGKHALFTGNAAALLGREITDAAGQVWQGLGLLDVAVRERRDTRYTGDAIARHPELERPLVGFFNHCEDWEGDVEPLLQVVMGRGNREGDSGEGFRKNNFLGTHLIGPVLVKNPHFHYWLLSRLLGRTPEPREYLYEEKAWQVTYDALARRKDQPAE